MYPRIRPRPFAIAAPLVLILALGSAGSAGAVNVVNNVGITPGSPAALVFNTQIDFTFDYEVDEPGALIFFRPYTGGSWTPNYLAHPSPSYSVGSGSGTAYFTIATGEVLVDHVRVHIVDATQTILLYEIFLPVAFHFNGSGAVTNIQLTPPSPALLEFGADVNISFDYETDHVDGVRIFFRPFSGGNPTENYAAHPSPVYPFGNGAGTGFFTIETGQVIVDEIKLLMVNPDQSVTFHEFRFPADYTFQTTAVEATTWGRVKRLYLNNR